MSQCHWKRLLSSRSRPQLGLKQSNMTVSVLSNELLILLIPNLNGWYIIINGNVLCKGWIVVVRVAVLVQVQNFVEYLSVLYFLYQ